MKKMAGGIMLMVALFSFSAYASSADWVYIGKNKVEPIYHYYIDCETIVIQGNKITYWVKERNNDIGEIKSRKTIDCKENVFRISDIVVYDSDGSLSKSNSFGNSGEWSAITPETMMNIQKLLLCHEDNYPRKELNAHIKGYEKILLREKKHQ